MYTPQEGRNTSAYLIGLSGQNKLDPAGFAVGSWAGPYGNLRDVFNFKNTVNASAVLTATYHWPPIAGVAAGLAAWAS